MDLHIGEKGEREKGEGGGGDRGKVQKFGHKSAITQQNRGPLDFLAIPSTPTMSKLQLQFFGKT